MTAKNVGLLDYLDKASVTLPQEDVAAPEWGGRTVTLRGWTSRERDLFEADNLRRGSAKAGNGAKRGIPTENDLTNFRARVVSRTIVEDGMRTCWNDRGEELLGNQSAAVLDRLYTVAIRLNGMSKTDIEELQGNSEAMEDSAQNTAEQASADAPSLN